jgi:uncharacterized protein (UPF0332 family)
MSLPKELLAVAAYLQKREPKKPKQATLRRAVSTAYYAFFHLLIQESTAVFVRGQKTKELPKIFGRIFEHTEMKDVAKAFADNKPPQIFATILQNSPVSADLQQVARTFVKAQEHRHRADYDLRAYFSKREVLQILNDIEAAFVLWENVKTTPAATVFLLALFTKKRLDGRK